MSFSQNLKHLRDTRTMTQEQLAMLLGVSRQAISKWESERAYPEMDKLERLCDLFGVSLDELVRGDLTGATAPAKLAVPSDLPATDVCGYDEHMRMRALLVALAVPLANTLVQLVGLVLSAVTQDPVTTVTTTFLGLRTNAVVGLASLACLAAGLAPVVVAVQEHARFRARHPFVEDFYTRADRLRARRSLAVELGVAAALLMLWVPLTNALAYVSYPLALTTFVGCVGVGLFLAVHAVLLWRRLDVATYNRVGVFLERRPTPSWVRTACASIMLTATVVGLWLLLAESYPRFLLAWAVGGATAGLLWLGALLFAVPAEDGAPVPDEAEL